MIYKNLKFIFGYILMCLLALASVTAAAQNKLPNIQAIGKITLKDGQTEEGIIAIGYTYDNRSFHPNAFYFESPSDKQLILIDLDFSGFYSELLEGKSGGKLFYAESKSDQSQSRYKTEDNDSGNVLNRKTLREENFVLRKEFGLYPELPLSLNVRAKITANENVKSYKVDEIASFELMRTPSERWLQKIQEAKVRLAKKMEVDKKRSNLWLEYQEPIWYHDIIHSNIELSRWRLYFD